MSLVPYRLRYAARLETWSHLCPTSGKTVEAHIFIKKKYGKTFRIDSNMSADVLFRHLNGKKRNIFFFISRQNIFFFFFSGSPLSGAFTQRRDNEWNPVSFSHEPCWLRSRTVLSHS